MGKWIVFEGIDGCGKTTISQKLVESLIERKQTALWHREPTDGKFGKKIRSFLKGDISLDPKEQWEAFCSDREESLKLTIIPALNQSKWIIQDRYFYSTAAYQGDRYASPEEIIRLSIERGFPEPDVLFFLDISPEEAAKRLSDRNSQEEVFDSLIEQRLIYTRYKKVLPKNTIYLDARKSPEFLVMEILSRIL